LFGIGSFIIGGCATKKKLLILDCNGMLWSSQKATSVPRVKNNHGVYYIQGSIYFERLKLHEFLARCFQVFDVAIWTCAQKRRMDAMKETIFTEDEQYQFKFVWDQSMTMNSWVRRPDGACNVMMKNLGDVWSRYMGEYDDTNTILIEDSPTKAFMNPSRTALHPPTFEFGDCTDRFLLDILWPFLERLSVARDMRRFLAINMPKWSAKNLEFDKKHNVEIYENLRLRYKPLEPSVPTYSIFHASEYEITYSEKRLISQLPYRNDNPQCINIFWSLVGGKYEGPYAKDPLKFIQMIREIRRVSDRLEVKDVVTKCNRDRAVDRDGKKLTCTNARCKLCKYFV